jgi:small GTP-binding protein
MDLREYEQLKFELAGILRGVDRYLSATGNKDPFRLRDLYARLAEDRFTLAIVGRFSRGKTSLMNAILGMDRLPTGILPLTSVITQISYGSEEKVVLYYYGTSLFMDIPLNKLADYITERGNPGNQRGIRVAEVQLPAEFLRRGFTFVDTPGLNSPIAANTRTTQAYLPEADAFILVGSYESPLTDEEASIASLALSAQRRLFVVLNKQDLVDTQTRAHMQKLVAERLQELGASGNVPIFSVSALQGLKAKQTGNEIALAESGFPAFETALIDFLVNHQRRLFLLQFCERVAAHLRPDAPQELIARLSAVQRKIHDGRSAPSAPVLTASAVPAILPECEVCAKVADAVLAHLIHFQSRISNNAEVRDAFVTRGGLCRLHARQLQAVAARRECAVAYAALLMHKAAALHALAQERATHARINEMMRRMYPEGQHCPACDVARRAAATAIQELRELAKRNGAHALLRRSALCLSHFRTLVAGMENPAIVQALLLGQAALMERMAENAHRGILKQDAGRRDLESLEEQTSVRQMASVLFGQPDGQYEGMENDEV